MIISLAYSELTFIIPTSINVLSLLILIIQHSMLSGMVPY
jgi:hypothetical protein